MDAWQLEVLNRLEALGDRLERMEQRQRASLLAQQAAYKADIAHREAMRAHFSRPVAPPPPEASPAPYREGPVARFVAAGGTAGGGGGGAGGALLVAIGNAVSACVLSADGGSGGPGATVDADIGAGGAGGDGGLVACIYGAGSVPTGTATGGMGGTGSNGVNAAQGAAGTVYIVSANI